MSQLEEEIELAEEALKDLKIMEDVSLRRRYITMYFAVYHAAQAVLLSLDYSAKTHSGIDSLVHNILFNKKELIDEEDASLFSKLKSRREQAEYGSGFYGSEEEFEELLQEAKNLAQRLTNVARKS